MKRIFTLTFIGALLSALSGNAQIFWVENFGTCSTSGAVGSYTGPNGTWTESVTTGGTYSNSWYVSGLERGHITGACGDDCSTGTGAGLEATLHLGPSSALGGDAGATYYAGGISAFVATTDKRAESPVINCTGKTGITLSFYYIENGDGTLDDGTVYYYDGTTWAPLTNPAKTSVCSGTPPQGLWDHVSVSLPASANNNPNVKIGFRWVNNDDATGTDPSFAIDSMSLSSSSTSTGITASFTMSDTAVCQDSCITFTSTSTGTIDSITWKIPGITIATPHAASITACFPSAGFYTVHLYAYHGTSADSTTHTIHVRNSPHPVVTQSGHILTVTGTYLSYQWYKTGVIIAGATNNSYTYTSPGAYTVVVDSGGCKGTSAAVNYNLGVAEISDSGTRFSIAQSGSNEFILYSSLTLSANLNVSVFDATGRQILNEQWQGGSDKKQISIDGLSIGLYIIRLANATTATVLKFQKQ